MTDTDEITALRAENERLRAALEEIAKVTRGWEPGVWSDEEGREYFAMLFFSAQRAARAALAAFSAPKSGWAPTDGQKQLDAARYSGNIAYAPLPPAPGKEGA